MNMDRMGDRDRLAAIERRLTELQEMGHRVDVAPEYADPDCPSCRETRELSQERDRFWVDHDRRRTQRRQTALATRVTPERRRAR